MNIETVNALLLLSDDELKEKGKWIPTCGEGSFKPISVMWIMVKTKDGKKTRYYNTPSAINDICLSDQYSYWFNCTS